MFFQSSVRSSLPDVLSQHVFMDTSGTFGRAIMDLGTTHSILLKEDAEESRDTANNRRVHPVAHAPGSKLLWQILETEGSCNIDKVTSDSLQVQRKCIIHRFPVCSFEFFGLWKQEQQVKWF